MIFMNKIKVNIHLTEVCNYNCRYCFAHFEKHNALSKEQWIKIIDNCSSSGLVKEINFAGGEPMLLPYLTDLAEHVNSSGLACSLITNASRMNEEWIIRYAGLFRTIGISVDSFVTETIKNTGRCTASGKIQDADRYAAIIRMIKQYHPEVKIKLNTVVNSLNKNELPADFFNEKSVVVDRWKLLKMTYFDDGCHDNSFLIVSDEEFNKFVKTNLEALGVSDYSNEKVLYHTNDNMEIVAERNINGAYYMIDAGGYLVDDTLNSSYTRVINCLDEPFSKGLEKLTLYADIYESRYAS